METILETDTPIFWLLCLEYPDLVWDQDVVTIYNQVGQALRRVLASRLTTI